MEAEIIKPDVETFKEHDTLIGRFQGFKRRSKDYPYPHFIFSDIECEHYTFLVPAYAALKYGLKDVKIGYIVKMIYTGDKKFKKGNAKQFRIFVQVPQPQADLSEFR